jgi:hypothetical protein
MYEQLQGVQGKKPKVDVTWIPQRSKADVSLTKLDACTTTVKSQPIDTTQNVTLTASIEDSMNLRDFQDFCVWNVERHKQYLIDIMINPLMESIDTQLLQKFATTVGDYYNSTNAAQTFNVINGSPQAADWGEFKKFLNSYEAIRGNGKPIIVGDGIIEIYNSIVGMGCCNLQGIDLSKAIGDAYFFKDNFASTELGTNKFLAWSPGSAQFIQWLEYSNLGPLGRIKENDAKVVWTLPEAFGGLKVDVHMHEDDCDDSIKMTMTCRFDLFNMPQGMYTQSEMIGVNGSLIALAAAV